MPLSRICEIDGKKVALSSAMFIVLRSALESAVSISISGPDLPDL